MQDLASWINSECSSVFVLSAHTWAECFITVHIATGLKHDLLSCSKVTETKGPYALAFYFYTLNSFVSFCDIKTAMSCESYFT